MELSEIAKAIANKAGMPYVWEDILNRLKQGRALPLRFTDDTKIEIVEKSPCCTWQDRVYELERVSLQSSFLSACMAGDIEGSNRLMREIEKLRRDYRWEPPEVHNKKQMAKLGRGRIF